MAEEPLPNAVLRQIGDKLYERRKVAALEVEQIVKRASALGNTNLINAIINKARIAHSRLAHSCFVDLVALINNCRLSLAVQLCSQDFAFSSNSNARKVGFGWACMVRACSSSWLVHGQLQCSTQGWRQGQVARGSLGPAGPG